MSRTGTLWRPEPNTLARYNGRYSTTLRAGYVVRVIEAAPGDRMLVEGMSKKGKPVQFAVKIENLKPITDCLFDSSEVLLTSEIEHDDKSQKTNN